MEPSGGGSRESFLEPLDGEAATRGSTPGAGRRVTEITALLGRGTRFEGKLCFEGRVRIGGLAHVHAVLADEPRNDAARPWGARVGDELGKTGQRLLGQHMLQLDKQSIVKIRRRHRTVS